jgi:pyruvate kinase
VEARRLRPHKTCALMMELRGREIRTSEVTDPKGIVLRSGQQLFIESHSHMLPSTSDLIYCNYKELPRQVKPNEIIFIDDGKIVCLVTECDAVFTFIFEQLC